MIYPKEEISNIKTKSGLLRKRNEILKELKNISVLKKAQIKHNWSISGYLNKTIDFVKVKEYDDIISTNKARIMFIEKALNLIN